MADSSDARYTAGMAVRRSVLGDAHVDRATNAATDFDGDFQRFVTEGAWGSVWARPHFTKRERSIVTIALLAALGHGEELRMHLRATENTGASDADILEALLHVAVYAGVPAANHAIGLAKAVLAERQGVQDAAGPAEPAVSRAGNRPGASVGSPDDPVAPGHGTA